MNMPCTDMRRTEIHTTELPARVRLKLLVLEADEQMMDKIVAAIEMVCNADSNIKQ